MLGLLIRANVWFSLFVMGAFIQDVDHSSRLAFAAIQSLVLTWIILYQMGVQRGLSSE